MLLSCRVRQNSDYTETTRFKITKENTRQARMKKETPKRCLSFVIRRERTIKILLQRDGRTDWRLEQRRFDFLLQPQRPELL